MRGARMPAPSHVRILRSCTKSAATARQRPSAQGPADVTSHNGAEGCDSGHIWIASPLGPRPDFGPSRRPCAGLIAGGFMHESKTSDDGWLRGTRPHL